MYVFLGVYFEKVLKSSDTSLWVRNIQMYLSGIVITLAGVYMNDGEKVLEKGFFFGYTPWVCFVVCKYEHPKNVVFSYCLVTILFVLPVLASVGGLYTSVVVKYTDNIMKGFSAALAIVLSTVASVMLFGLQISTLVSYNHIIGLFIQEAQPFFQYSWLVRCKYCV